MSSKNNRLSKPITAKPRPGLRPIHVKVGGVLIATVQDESGKVGNWVTKISSMIKNGELNLANLPRGILDLDVSHDDWCGLHSGSICNCDPSIELRKDPSRN